MICHTRHKAVLLLNEVEHGTHLNQKSVPVVHGTGRVIARMTNECCQCLALHANDQVQSAGKQRLDISNKETNDRHLLIIPLDETEAVLLNELLGHQLTIGLVFRLCQQELANVPRAGNREHGRVDQMTGSSS